MSSEDLSRRLRATFLQEMEDQLSAMETSLLTLESSPADREAIRTLFRAAHSVKGAARVAGVPLVEQACHELETVFAEVRDGRRELSGSDFSLLFAIRDALGEAHRRLHAEQPLENSTLEALLPRLSGTLREFPAADHAHAGRADEVSEPPSGAGTAQHTDTRTEARTVGSDLPPPAGEPGSSRGGRASGEDAGDGLDDEVEVDLPTEDAEAASRQAATESVRVSTERLDELAGYASDLLTTSGAIGHQPQALEELRDGLSRWAAAWRDQARAVTTIVDRDEHAELDRQLHQLTATVARLAREGLDRTRVLARTTSDVLDSVRRLRLRRLGDAVEGLPRAARDIAAGTGKEIRLVIEGQDLEVDRMVVDSLREPLLHLVRNAVDHGIESPDERVQQGKPREGTVRIAADIVRGRLRIVVEDDGHGIDTQAVRRRLVARGEAPPEDARGLARRLLAGGITTRDEATNFSGRGVGLDIVGAAMERIGGSVALRWREGAFTRFILDSPPSPSTLRAVIVEASDQLFALPIGEIDRVVQVQAAEVKEVDGRPAMTLGDAPIPIVTLSGVLGPPLRERQEIAGAIALVIRTGEDSLALVVDAIADEREVVVRPLERKAHVPLASGGALLPSGRVALVLVPRTLVEAGLSGDSALPVIQPPEVAPAQRHVLVVDDSITTRTLEQSVLETAGYRVTVAVDGYDAWDRLTRDPPDLVISDVEMPRMNGFDLCRRIRSARRFAELPIVLVTGMETADDRALGMEVGADAYILKSSFDQTALLDTIRQLIN